MIRRVRRGARDERGAVAIIIALLAVFLFGMAAFAIDISMLGMERQKLHDHIDTAAHAGAYELPSNGATASAKAISMATSQDASLTPSADLFCVVSSIGTPPVVKVTQIPSTCYPGAAPYTAVTYPGLRCNASICAIPCPSTTGFSCNTIRVSDSKLVPYRFAPVLGYNSGDTGAVTSVACKGSCGAESPNPMDVAIVADRTGSMSPTDVGDMITGIKSMLTVMNPSLQYVSLGTIGPAKAVPPAACKSEPYSGTLNATGTGWKWHSLPFTNDYLNATTPPTVKTTNDLVKAVNCLTLQSSTGTHLAAPMKGAARYLLGTDANNLGSLPARVGTPKKVIIFETDGQPNEDFSGGSTSITGVGGYPGSTDGATACTNLRTVASEAKAAGIIVITVAYNLDTQRCGGATSATVTSTLALSASKDAAGNDSDADNTCNTVAERIVENGDGDYFFCAASGTDMSSLFQTAINSVSGGIKLIKMP